MLAELAACNAAFGIVKKFVQNGRSIADCAKQIGVIVESKDKLQKKVQKKRNGFMSALRTQQATDLEEFLALESIKEAEAELKQMMIYSGRAGLWDSWLLFQKQARVSRREAEKEAQRQHEEMMYKIYVAAAISLLISGLAGFLYSVLLYTSHI